MKFDIKQPPPRPSTLEESNKLIIALWEACRHLEEKQNTNSANASKPPSSDGLLPTSNKRQLKPKARSKRQTGAQPGHEGKTVERVLSATVTCRLQQRNALEYMTAAVSAYLENKPALSLLPVQEESLSVLQAA